MATLKNEHKELIVIELGMFNKPVDIQKRLISEFNIEVPLSQIATYNPETTSSSRTAKKWKELYWHTREEYQDRITSHAISKKGYRLGMLQKIVESSINTNKKLALQALEQGAKEVGGFYESGDAGGASEIDKEVARLAKVYQYNYYDQRSVSVDKEST